MFSLDAMLVQQIARKTGFTATVGNLSVNPITGRLHLKNLQIGNAAAYPLSDFLSAPEVRLRGAIRSLWTRQVEVEELSIHIDRLTAVRTASGQVNLQQFRAGLERREGLAAVSPARRTSRQYQIGRLELKLDRIIRLDYGGGEVRRMEYPLDLHRSFERVHDPLSLAPVLLQDLTAVGLAPAEDAILSSLLPDLLWAKIRELVAASSG